MALDVHGADRFAPLRINAEPPAGNARMDNLARLEYPEHSMIESITCRIESRCTSFRTLTQPKTQKRENFREEKETLD